jgi:hypothetical protein
MTAGSAERVEVPFGTVSAVRLDWEFAVKGGNAQKSTFWYAHGIGLVRVDDEMKL